MIHLTITPSDPRPAFANLYRSLGAAGPLTDALNAEAPHVLEIHQRIRTLTNSARALKPPRTDDYLAHQIATELEAGRGVPEDLLTTVAGTSDSQTALTRTVTLLQGVGQNLASERDEALRSASDALLGHLNQQLADLLTDLPESARTAPPSAEAALDADRGADYKAHQAAAQQYAAIRSAQGRLAGALWGRETVSAANPWWSHVGYIGDPVAAWPDYLEWKRKGHVTDEHGARRFDTPWPDLSDAEAFDWLLRHPEAKPWIPTRQQYDALVHELGMATRPDPTPKGRNPLRQIFDQDGLVIPPPDVSAMAF